jgi:hypothetical protein
MPQWLKTAIRLIPIVGGGSLIAIAGLVVVRRLAPLEDLRSASDAVGNYLQTVGGIYAVLLAFTVFVVWGQFNDGRNFVAREATVLVDLHRTASGLPRATRSEIQAALRAYLDDVLTSEWDAMAIHDEETLERVGQHLDCVWSAIHRCRPTNDCEHAIYSEVLSRFNDLSDSRTSRLTASRTRIPLLMRLLLYLGGAIVVCSIYLLSIDNMWIHAMITAALAGSVAHIVFLIEDLDNAFAGHLQISKAPFERALRAVQRFAHHADALEA